MKTTRGLSLLVLAVLIPACDPNLNNGNVDFATTIRVSVGVNGEEANEASHSPSLSADGRFVAFSSTASNLHPDDLDSLSDIYVRDLLTNTTILVSRADGASGAKGNGASFNPSISANGRFVAFESLSDNLHTDDPPGDLIKDIFVRDLVLNTTTLASRADGVSGAKLTTNSLTPSISGDGRFVCYATLQGITPPFLSVLLLRDLQLGVTTTSSGTNPQTNPATSQDGSLIAFTDQTLAGTGSQVRSWNGANSAMTGCISHTFGIPANQANGPSQHSAFSADGQFVAFTSDATDLLSPGLDSNGVADIYVWSRATQLITRVSLANSGVEAAGANSHPSPSADASIVAFESVATNLVNDDSNQCQDIFVRDTVRGTTLRVSVRTFGGEANGISSHPSLSGDGRFVAFESIATNMVGGDTNNATDIFVRGPLR